MSVKIDMWYGDKISETTYFDYSWSDCDYVYRGNLYKDGKMVGDFTSSTLQEIEQLWISEKLKAKKLVIKGEYKDGSELVFNVNQLNYDLRKMGYDHEHRNYIIRAIFEKAKNNNTLKIKDDEFAHIYEMED